MTDKQRLELGDSVCSLIVQAREGCQHSRNELVAQLRSYMALVARRKKDPAFQAKFGESDVVQQSILVASEKFEQFRGTTEQELRAWVNQILKNEFAQHQRALRAEKRDLFREQPIENATPDDTAKLPHVQLVDRQPTPGTGALQKENSEALERAMERLPAEYRKVIQLRNWEGKSFPEIGSLMNRSGNAVTKLWYRALIQLRRLLEEADG